jgi:AraC-like DNA-binding protein
MHDLQALDQDKETLLSFLKQLRQRKGRIHIPPRRELYRRRGGAQFHTAPELFFQTGGATDFDCPGKSFRCNAGDICVMPRGVSHREAPVDQETPYSVLVCIHNPRGISLIRGHSPRPGTIVSYRAEGFNTLQGQKAFIYLDRIAEAEHIEESERDGYIRRLLDVFIVSLITEVRMAPSAEDHSIDPVSTRVRQAQQIAESNLADPHLSVASLATSLQCSSDHLSRQFHQQAGATLSQWIQSKRIEMSRHLLSHSTRNISEICWACGFNAPSYFIRIFRRHTGMTPRQYRLQHHAAKPQRL